MKALASYVMRGRRQAGLLAVAFAVLAMILPPLSNVSGAIVALVTLRRGWQEGLLVSGIAVVVVAGLAYIVLGNPLLALVYFGAVWLPAWGLAWVLRATVSLRAALSVATAVALVGVVWVYSVLDDPTAWWKATLVSVFDQAIEQAKTAEITGLQDMLENAAPFMTGVVFTAFLLSLGLSLFLARWWQSVLYNPGGFAVEFRALRLPKGVTLAGAGLFVVALFSGGGLAADMAVVLLGFFGVIGLALVHDWVFQSKLNVAWLIVLYLILGFAAPHLMAVLALAAIVDAWIDIRRFFKVAPGN